MIKIYIGEETEPYLVAESTLTNASEYFVKALKHETTLGGAEPGVLRFSEDGNCKDGWETLLYWLTRKQLPNRWPAIINSNGDSLLDDAFQSWIQAWVLGDKYLLPEFQDTIMLEMLIYLDNATLDGSDIDSLNVALRMSPVDSPLRRILAEEAIYTIYVEKAFQPEDLAASDGTIGLSASLLNAQQYFVQNEDWFPRIQKERNRAKSKAWKEYLVGPVPVHRRILDYFPRLLDLEKREDGSSQGRTTSVTVE